MYEKLGPGFNFFFGSVLALLAGFIVWEYSATSGHPDWSVLLISAGAAALSIVLFVLVVSVWGAFFGAQELQAFDDVCFSFPAITDSSATSRLVHPVETTKEGKS
jgi:hypothetical protein